MFNMSWGVRIAAACLVFVFGCDGEITSSPVDSNDNGNDNDIVGDSGIAGDPDGGAVVDPDEPRVNVVFAPDDSLFPNPERGFTVIVDPTDLGDLQSASTKGVTIVNALAHLDAYRDQDLPAEYLDQLAAGFDEARVLGLKLVLRFRYDDGGGRDASQAQLLRHIEQLKPLLREHAGVIAVLQAGFIGAWGEWHTSVNGLDSAAGRGAVLFALLDALPVGRSVQIRTPDYKADLFPGGPMTEADARSDSEVGRVGHHNDCFLASDSDFGTYPSPVSEWRDYVAQESQFTPVGGETCALYMPRSGCESAVAEMTMLHWSYLNKTYHPAVLSDWQSEGCYDEVERRLGYRLELLSASWPETVTAGGTATIQLTVRNSGFAAPFNARPVYLVLESATERVEIPVAGADPRHWAAGADHVVTTNVEIPDLAAGSYRMSLWLPDADPSLANDSAFSIRLANQDTWDAVDGVNVLTNAVAVAR